MAAKSFPHRDTQYCEDVEIGVIQISEAHGMQVEWLARTRIRGNPLDAILHLSPTSNAAEMVATASLESSLVFRGADTGLNGKEFATVEEAVLAAVLKFRTELQYHL